MYEPKYCARLRELREGKGLTQSEVGRILGISRKLYSAIETGRSLGGYVRRYRELRISEAVRLAKFYGVSIEYIIGGAE